MAEGGVRRKGEDAFVFEPWRDLCHGKARHSSWEWIMRAPGLGLQGYHILQISEIGLLRKAPEYSWRRCGPAIDAKVRPTF
jgi:hypothetical protein